MNKDKKEPQINGEYCPRCTCEQMANGKIVVGHFIETAFCDGECIYCGGKMVKYTNEPVIKATDYLVIPKGAK